MRLAISISEDNFKYMTLLPQDNGADFYVVAMAQCKTAQSSWGGGCALPVELCVPYCLIKTKELASAIFGGVS